MKQIFTSILECSMAVPCLGLIATICAMGSKLI